MTPRERLRQARLYLVTDGRRPDLPAFLDAALGAGVDVLQLRDKEQEAGGILRAATTFREACDRHGAIFVINDRVDLAIAAGADGVHVGQGDIDPKIIRDRFGDELIVGRSTHTPEQMRAALLEPVDYVCVGPVHATPTKPGRAPAGLDLVRLAAKEADGAAVWFAIGGIDATTLPDVVAAGAHRIVVVRAVTEAADARAAAGAVAALRAGLAP